MGRRLEVDVSQKTCLLLVNSRVVLAIWNSDVSKGCFATGKGEQLLITGNMSRRFLRGNGGFLLRRNTAKQGLTVAPAAVFLVIAPSR